MYIYIFMFVYMCMYEHTHKYMAHLNFRIQHHQSKMPTPHWLSEVQLSEGDLWDCGKSYPFSWHHLFNPVSVLATKALVSIVCQSHCSSSWVYRYLSVCVCVFIHTYMRIFIFLQYTMHNLWYRVKKDYKTQACCLPEVLLRIYNNIIEWYIW